MSRCYYDVYRSFLVKNAVYDGKDELPWIKTSRCIPNRVVTFSKAMLKEFRDFDCWVVFYEHDVGFERLWHNPKQYLNKLKKFNGIISPDFSLYRNMPLVMQKWNTYRGRALAAWLQKNGIEVIPNVRFNDERTYEFCFDGIEWGKTVAVGTLGTLQNSINRRCFKNGLKELFERLAPENLIVYGCVPEEIFGEYRDKGVNIVAFEPEILTCRKGAVRS